MRSSRTYPVVAVPAAAELPAPIRRSLAATFGKAWRDRWNQTDQDTRRAWLNAYLLPPPTGVLERARPYAALFHEITGKTFPELFVFDRAKALDLLLSFERNDQEYEAEEAAHRALLRGDEETFNRWYYRHDKEALERWLRAHPKRRRR
jgi:hypothetical protein